MSEQSMEAVDQAREAQVKEYGTYVAKEPIQIDGALAFAAGHAVPASHVERGVVDKSQVARVGTKAAETVTKEG